MEFKSLSAVYFSPTDVSRRYALALCEGFGVPFSQKDITSVQSRELISEFSKEDLVVFSSPVYFGRIAPLALDYFKSLKGNGAKAVAMVSYGNRDFDDALAELGDTLSQSGFKVIAGVSVVGRHSFTGDIAGERPDKKDLAEVSAFAKTILSGDEKEVVFEGNRPYKGKIIKVKLKSSVSSACNDCKVCANVCPVGAIDKNDVKKVDLNKCILCHACEVKCPQKARVFSSLPHKFMVKVMKKQFGGNKCENKLYL
ncbi:MAG: 4Fe-4S binding protein [Oscillospiraceae bacterium]